MSWIHNAPITTGEIVYVYLAGFTTGSCNNVRGQSITKGNVLLWPSAGWDAQWVEGTVADEYGDSYLKLTARKTFPMNERTTIVVDRSNEIKANCGLPRNWRSFQIKGPDTQQKEIFNQTSGVNGTCYLTDTALSFRTGRPGENAQITIALKPAMTLGPGAKVIVNIHGFTRGDAPTLGEKAQRNGLGTGLGRGESEWGQTLDLALGKLRLTDREFYWPWNASDVDAWTSFSRFDGQWEEGCCAKRDEAGFENGTITLRVRAGEYLAAGQTYSVVVAAENGLQAVCGLAGNDPLHTITVKPYFRTAEAYSAYDDTFAYDDESDDTAGKRYIALNDDNQEFDDAAIDDVIEATTTTSRMSALTVRRISRAAVAQRNAPTAPFDRSGAMGDNCESLNYCSIKGTCDVCLNRCICEKGFGAPQEIRGGAMLSTGDCSLKTCPLGRARPSVAWRTNRSGTDDLLSMMLDDKAVASPFDDDGPADDDDKLRNILSQITPAGIDAKRGLLVECSANGDCERGKGTCSCYSGFAGKACERQLCPAPKGVDTVCSGHGVCLPMRSLVQREDALPLSRPKQDETTGIPFYFGQSYSASSDPNGAIALWEARTLHACVCESSWPVGLKRNETQESEYFGPDCSLKRCPTGDDPETIVDETDCTNKTAAGGRGVGKSGNKCHLDCSGRGMCDYLTGNCYCSAGFHGDNCGQKNAMAIGMEL